MSFGHIKISRKVFDDRQGDEFWHERRKFSRWEAWEDCIQLAAWEDYARNIRGETVTIPRGCFFGSVRFFAERWMWSNQAVLSFFDRTATVTRTRTLLRTPVGTLYLLVNYETYQAGRNASQNTERNSNPNTLRNKEEAISNKRKTLGAKNAPDQFWEFEEEFKSVWAEYPKRAGSNSRPDAFRQFRFRRAEGVEVAVMREGTKRYRLFCEATEKVGTELTMQGARFYGKGKGYEEAYDIPVGKGAPLNPKAQATWKLMVSSGVHLASTAESRQSIIDTLVSQGQLKDGEKFLTFLKSIDKTALTRLSAQGDDKGCVKLIAEKMENAA